MRLLRNAGLVMGMGVLVAGCGSMPEETSAVARIEAPEGSCWSGSIGDVTRDGCGSSRVELDKSWAHAVMVQKDGDDTSPLTVIIEIDGQEKDRGTTTAAYGVVTVTAF